MLETHGIIDEAELLNEPVASADGMVLYNQYGDPETASAIEVGESVSEILSDTKKSGSKSQYKMINRKQKATYNNPYAAEKKPQLRKKK